MRREGAERKQAGREWQQGKDRRAGEGEGERWAAWITRDAAPARADAENEAVGNGRTEEQETLHMELGGDVIACADKGRTRAAEDAGTETLESRLRRFVWFSS
jgi:hypothetical protein